MFLSIRLTAIRGHVVSNLNIVMVLSVIALQLSVISGCAVVPKKLDNQHQVKGDFFERRAAQADSESKITSTVDSAEFIESDLSLALVPVFSPGDMLRLQIHGMSDFDGLYQINVKGDLELPFSAAMQASGHTRASLTHLIEQELVRLRWFYKDSVKVSLSVVQLAAINVSVSGAVFNAGRVSVNAKPVDSRSGRHTPRCRSVSNLSQAWEYNKSYSIE